MKKPLFLILCLLLAGGTAWAENPYTDAYNWKSAYEMKKENPNLLCGYETGGAFRCCDPDYVKDCK